MTPVWCVRVEGNLGLIRESVMVAKYLLKYWLKTIFSLTILLKNSGLNFFYNDLMSLVALIPRFPNTHS